MSFKLTWRSQVICILISLALVIIMYSVVDSILFKYFVQGFLDLKYAYIEFVISISLLMIPVTIVHEAVHGAAYKLFGGKVRFGFKGIYAYTQEISGKAIVRAKFLIVLLSPLVVISVLSLLLPTWLGGMVFLLNLLGASGDIYMSLYLCKFGKDSKIIDRKYGFDVLNSNH